MKDISILTLSNFSIVGTSELVELLEIQTR